jgi:D-tyrosyl-tRNA(Tyr) deacylase
MRAVIQRAGRAGVSVDGRSLGEIGRGLAVLLGVAEGDGEDEARWMAAKLCELRIFEDEEGKMNLSLEDVGGEMLVVSQFTLLADCRKGRRPSFVGAAPPDEGERFYERVVSLVRERGVRVATGSFGAHMLVSIENDGPVTIVLDTRERGRTAGEGAA